MKVNRNHCYYCGIQVDPNNYENIGTTTIWVCDDRKCQKELSDDIKSHLADEREIARDERENGWKYF